MNIVTPETPRSTPHIRRETSTPPTGEKYTFSNGFWMRFPSKATTDLKVVGIYVMPTETPQEGEPNEPKFHQSILYSDGSVVEVVSQGPNSQTKLYTNGAITVDKDGKTELFCYQQPPSPTTTKTPTASYDTTPPPYLVLQEL